MTSNSDNNKAHAIFEANRQATTRETSAQAELTHYMFNSPTYDKDWCTAFLGTSGKDKTKLIDRTINAMDDQHSADCIEYESLKKAKDVNSKVRKQKLDKTIRANRQMLKRTVSALYGLRVQDVLRVTLRRDKSIKVDVMEDGEENYEVFSANELVNRGNAAYRDNNKITPPAPSKTSGNGKAMSKAARIIQFENMTTWTKSVKDISDLENDESEAVTELFVTLLRKHFEVDGKIDANEVAEFISEHDKPTMEIVTEEKAA